MIYSIYKSCGGSKYNISKEEFYEELNNYVKKFNENLGKIETRFNKVGQVCFRESKPRRNQMFGDYYIFMKYPDEVDDLITIIEENEYDACDGDSLTIAMAIYNAGYRKIEQGESK